MGVARYWEKYDAAATIGNRLSVLVSYKAKSCTKKNAPTISRCFFGLSAKMKTHAWGVGCVSS